MTFYTLKDDVIQQYPNDLWDSITSKKYLVLKVSFTPWQDLTITYTKGFL